MKWKFMYLQSKGTKWKPTGCLVLSLVPAMEARIWQEGYCPHGVDIPVPVRVVKSTEKWEKKMNGPTVIVIKQACCNILGLRMGRGWAPRQGATTTIPQTRQAEDEGIAVGSFTTPTGQRSVWTMKGKTKEGRAEKSDRGLRSTSAPHRENRVVKKSLKTLAGQKEEPVVMKGILTSAWK